MFLEGSQSFVVFGQEVAEQLLLGPRGQRVERGQVLLVPPQLTVKGFVQSYSIVKAGLRVPLAPRASRKKSYGREALNPLTLYQS